MWVEMEIHGARENQRQPDFCFTRVEKRVQKNQVIYYNTLCRQKRYLLI